MKYKPKTAIIQSKYTGVTYHFVHSCKREYWRFSFKCEGRTARKNFPFTDDGERQAAIFYDKKLIENNREPVNILKQKCA